MVDRGAGLTECEGAPPILPARTIWFHDGDLANALIKSAAWIRGHQSDGAIETLIVSLGYVTPEGYGTHGEDDEAIERWSVGVVQDR